MDVDKETVHVKIEELLKLAENGAFFHLFKVQGMIIQGALYFTLCSKKVYIFASSQ